MGLFGKKDPELDKVYKQAYKKEFRKALMKNAAEGAKRDATSNASGGTLGRILSSITRAIWKYMSTPPKDKYGNPVRRSAEEVWFGKEQQKTQSRPAMAFPVIKEPEIDTSLKLNVGG